MLFNSFEFLLFLPTVFVLYWFVFNKRLGWQNLLLLAASYVFYGWWDWRFLSLIVFSSTVDYFCGLQIAKNELRPRRRLWLTLSILTNLGFLGVFKYFNFFSTSLAEAFESIGYRMDLLTLDVVLPVGISFYTFQTMSYTIDVYRRKMQPTRNALQFFAYVSFFPQLVAGPIERASNLLPQFQKERKFDYEKATDGLRQILWGLFKKIVVADNCALIVNQVFENYETMGSTNLILGVFFFAFQIYGDFSGYSDIAIGTARLFGFNLMQNFAFPYFSRDIAEFWRRWHISLSTWFRDYLYIPLGGSRGGTSSKIKNTFIIFLVSGFWHGANWTFIFWGLLNAIYFLPLLLMKKNRLHTNTVSEGRLFINLREFAQIGITFILTMLAWIFFRANSVTEAFLYTFSIFDSSILSLPTVDIIPILYIVILVVVEWLQRNRAHGLHLYKTELPILRWGVYAFFFCMILFFGAKAQSFIYFQF